jgi:hypothetical protein
MQQQQPPPSDKTDGDGDGGGGGDEQAVASTTASMKKSALQDNIERKGKNAYYFAHAHKSSGPKWDGKEQPKLLSKTAVSTDIDSHAGHLHRSSSTSTFDYTKSNITTYAFIDEPNKVKIYIENLHGVGVQCSDNDIALDYTPTSLSLVIHNYRTPGTTVVPVGAVVGASSIIGEKDGEGEPRDAAAADATATAPTTTTTLPTTTPTLPPKCLAFSKLTGRITKAVYKKKDDRIILILTKEEEGEWRTINCKGGIKNNNADQHHHHQQHDDQCHEVV